MSLGARSVDPIIWIAIALAGCVVAAFLYVVIASITF